MARITHTSTSHWEEPPGSLGSRARGSADGSGTLAVGAGAPCAICSHAGARPRTVHHMTHGVFVWLCEAHGNSGFLSKDYGTAFTQRLSGMWIASGVLTGRRMAALRAHVRQIQFAGADRDQPGSYSWPQLRHEAEQRFAAGHDPRQVIQELRDRHCDCPAMAPSPRTMRRWYAQARWLAPCRTRNPKSSDRGERLPIPAQFALIPYAMAKYVYWGYYQRPRRGS